MRKILVTAALTGTLALTGMTAASAVELYPATPATGGVDTGTTPPGGPVTFTGNGMTANEQVTITITCTSAQGAATTTTATVTADARGTFSYTAVMDNPGSCTFTAVGSGSAATAAAQVSVADRATSQSVVASGQGLASTGVDSSTALWGAAGIGALVLGSAAVVVSRRRSVNAAA
jgi:LPXTG-motif cell wall-anchored protein